MTRIFYDDIAFRKMFPELSGASLAFCRAQWALVGQYISGRPETFTNPGIGAYMKLLAHVVKLNLMAQMGVKVDGIDVPVITPPNTPTEFKNWLQQTQYGCTLG